MLNYKKKFIILKNKYSNIKGYRPKGHMKLEIKGAHTNIDVNIENAEADSSYNLTLITEEIIDLGKIYTDSYGRTKSELSLRTDDFLQGELEEGAVLLHRGKEVLLGEYMDKDDGRLEEFIEGLRNQAVDLDPEPVIELEPVTESELEPQLEPELEPQPEPEHQEEEIEPIEEALQVEREFYEEVIEPKHEKIEEIAPELEELEQPKEEEVWTEEGDYEFQEQFKESSQGDEEEVDTEEIGQEEYVDLEYEYNLKKTEQTTSYVLSVLRYFSYAEPFEQELYDHNWWRIDYNGEVEEGFLPYFNYIADTNAIELMKKYKHYLFGLYNQGDEVKFYIYGVPGAFTIDEHPNAGESGFKTWFKGVEEEGYWLLYIDPMTGRVIEPLDPMNPS